MARRVITVLWLFLSFGMIALWMANPWTLAARLAVTAGHAALTVAVAWWAHLNDRRVARAERLRTGNCPACASDLRASPGRCPECGAGQSTPAAARPPTARAFRIRAD